MNMDSTPEDFLSTFSKFLHAASAGTSLYSVVAFSFYSVLAFSQWGTMPGGSKDGVELGQHLDPCLFFLGVHLDVSLPEKKK